MELRAQSNGIIMASKRVEIGLVSEACPILPAAIYFVRLPSCIYPGPRGFSWCFFAKEILTWMLFLKEYSKKFWPRYLMSAFLSLTEQQKKALFAALSRKDVFTILSTGHGKYIIFQTLPDVCKYFSLRGYSNPRRAIILVVCPLKSLVDSHIRELRNRGVSATSLSSPDVDDQNLVSRCIYHFLLQYCHSIK